MFLQTHQLLNHKHTSTSQRDQNNEASQGLARLLHFWCRIASPPEPDNSASFEEKERFRRGRIGSQIIIFLYFVLLLSYSAAFAGSNIFLVVILSIDLYTVTLAVVLNHKGMVNIAGIIVALSFIASPTTNILTPPGGVNTNALTVFGLLIPL